MSEAASSIFRSDLPLDAKLDRARTELLDLGARNRLLNVPRFSKSARTIEIVDERSAEVFRLLRDGRAFTFLPGREGPGDGSPASEETDDFLDLPQPGDDEVDERGVAGRHSDTRLQTRMTSKGLQKRLLDLFHDARTLEEEQGVNILFLALGLLKWIDPAKAESPRYAPLILVPVSLERASAGEKFKLRGRPEDPASNLSLEAYLDRVHALRLPPFEGGDDFDASGYLFGAAQAVSTKQGWEVAPDDIVLGFFSFAKFLMYRDLDPANWPANGRLTEKPLVRGLLAEGFETKEPLVPADASVDAHIAPADMLHIVDSDSSQTLAIHEAAAGRDLVIQGPPGTGKSQTIANIIAGAIAGGKTVLFVAEKMAALEVVKRRLDHAGVGDACLELHSNKANKRLLLEELRRTWELGSPRGDFPSSLTAKVHNLRDLLNAHAARMHREHEPSAVTPYQVIGHLTRLRREGRNPVDIDLSGLEAWTPDDLAERRALLSELIQRIEDIGPPGQHPWRGIGLDMVLPTALERLKAGIARLGGAADQFARSANALAVDLETFGPETLADVDRTIVLARRVAEAPDLEGEALKADAWSSDASEIASLIATGHEFSALSDELAGVVTPSALEADVEMLRPQLAWLPPDFGPDAFHRARLLSEFLPRLTEEAEHLRSELGSAAAVDSIVSVARLVATGDRVANAPDASPEAFAATVWDHGVEQAADLAEAVKAWEEVRTEFGDSITDAGWTIDVASARQALASHTGFFRRLNGEWRRASALARAVLKRPDAPLSERLVTLDALMRGQRASRTILDNEAFGRSAFGSDWRGDKSTSAPLLALVAWMRTLRGLGAEPRLIAGRLPERSAIGERAAVVQRLLGEAYPLLQAIWADLGDMGAPSL